MMPELNLLNRIVEANVGVDPAYRHVAKHVTLREPLETAGAMLKWYDLHPTDRGVPDEIHGLARRSLAAHRLEAEGMGFVVLHRCGGDFYFLIVCTWRNSNEIWESVFYKDGDAMPDFAPFTRPTGHLPTFCVWELMPVWHEKQAWVRFLTSARDEAAANAWLRDGYDGPA